MAIKHNATVCGVRTRLGGSISYGGGHIAPGARSIGKYAPISKPGAKRLVKELFGHERLPRPGYEIKLCGDQYLANTSGSYHVSRRASGDFAGASKKKRR